MFTNSDKYLMIIALSIFLGLFYVQTVDAQEKGKLVLISDQFSFTEGPTRDTDGNVYFTDQPNNTIWKYDTDNQLSLFLKPAGRSNGLFFDNSDQLLACADEKNQLWRISENKVIDTLIYDFEGKLLNGPNDLWVSPTGIIYITDPYYERDYWNREGQVLPMAVYAFQDNQLTQIDTSYVRPNGIVGTDDGKLLYVSDIGDDKTYVYDVDKSGRLLNRRLFCELGSDGMTLDEKGNLYLTGNGVTVFNAKGELIHHIDIPANWTANVTFGGKNKEYLFITASEKIFKIYPDWIR